ncbi:MAG: glycine cleavage system protein H [Bacteroidia bacterium]|nr:glycine cleavage system protein H [Bacteroidia bacterium]
MEGFSRVDIFDTKGIEYIFVIGYLVLLIIFWKISNKQVSIGKQIQQAIGNLTANMLRIPQGLFYSKNHTWAHLEESGAARVGMDDLLQHITGEVRLDQMKSPGEIIRKGELLTEIHQEGKHLRVFSPISGTIMDANTDLSESPELVNQDPYNEGWFYRIKPSDWRGETGSYYLAEEAVSWSVKELERFKDFLAVSMKKVAPEPSLVAMQDGGELLDNTLSHLPNEVWEEFQRDFLDHTT